MARQGSHQPDHEDAAVTGERKPVGGARRLTKHKIGQYVPPVKNIMKTRMDRGAVVRHEHMRARAQAARGLNQTDTLARLRRQIAEQTQQLAERELEARLLRLDIASDLRRNGCTKTEAETLAKAHPRYIAHERDTIRLDLQRALWEAEAEALAFRLKEQVKDGAPALTAQLAVATLLAPWWARATPAEQQKLLARAARLVGLVSAASEPRAAGPAETGPDDAA